MGALENVSESWKNVPIFQIWGNILTTSEFSEGWKLCDAIIPTFGEYSAGI